jgi:hypothetical protein
VPHERGKMKQSLTWIDTGAIPSQQGLYCEGVAKAVQTGRTGTCRRNKLCLWQEMMESLADGLWTQWLSMVIAEREQRIVRSPWAVPVYASDEVGFDMLAEVRTKGHEAAFAEFGFMNHKQSTVLVHISMAKPRGFSDSQAETVHQPENQRIDFSTMGGAWIIWQLRSYFEEALDLLRLEEERQTPRTGRPRTSLHWRTC